MKIIKNILFPALLILTAITGRSQQTGRFSGSVTNSGSGPVARASIHLLNTNLTSLSDSHGKFSFENIPFGNYTIRVQARGYAALNTTVAFESPGPHDFPFVLSDALVELDDVYVTSQKKDESLQSIPLSISALSAEKIKESSLWNSKELTATVPNLYAANPGDERNVTAIRGITSTSYDPAISTYIDGVSQFSLDTYIAQLSDIERIEVLRGPQGTLYGRNAMGGVINIITRQPGNALSGSMEAGTGNFGQLRLNPVVRFPLVKNRVFVGWSSVFTKRDGFYTNSFNNSGFDDQHAFSGNGYLKFLAGKKLAFTVNAKFQQVNNKGAFPLVNGIAEALDHPFVLSQNAISEMTDRIFNLSLSANYTGNHFNLTSQAAYQYNHRYYDKPLDGDFSPIDGITILNHYKGRWNKVRVFTEELRLASPANASGRLKWVAGAYFFHQENPTRQGLHFGEDAAMLGSPDTNFTTISTTKANGYGISGYGQATYAILKKLSLVAGLRYDYEEKKYSVLGEYEQDSDPGNIFQTRPDTLARANFRSLSPKLGLSYEINRDRLAFLTYSKGYRAGGLTGLSSDPSSPPLHRYKPEYSNNVELGMKNNLLNKHLQFNLTLFLTKVTDIQVPTLVYPDAVTLTKNAGELLSRGFELEVYSKPFHGFQADGTFGYTDARFRNLKYAQNGTNLNLDGNRQVFTPKTTAMLAMQYDYRFKGNFKMTVRGEWRNLGTQFFDFANTIKQESYSLFNNALGISYKQTSLMVWVKNSLNEKYIAYAYDFGAAHLGDPRTFGVTVLSAF